MGALDLQTNESEEKKESLEAIIEKDDDSEQPMKGSQKKSSFAWRFFDFASTFPF